MSETTAANTGTDLQKSTDSIRYDDRLYGLVENIRSDLEFYGVEPDQVSIDMDTEISEDSVEFQYKIETLGWYEDDGELGLGQEAISFNNSYSIDASTAIPENEVVDILEDTFGEAAIKANGKVIQDCLSPDYNAF